MSDNLRAALERVVAGRFTVERELGRGGMGAVFLARDLSLNREVAIKVLPPELATQPALRERFVREAQLAGSLSHPNIVHVHAVEEHADLLAFVMHFVDGETLTERVTRVGPYDAQGCARLLQDTAWALGYAHARGIVHRDVKPDNLLIERGTGRVLIMDFGIARQERASGLTEVGHSVGTPHYMSPEQAAGETVDGRSDLYSLGCVGFFAAAGRPPFEGESAHKLLMQHLTAAPPLVTALRPEFPQGLTQVIAKALEKDPANRFESGEAMADAIGALQLRTREVAPLLRLFRQQTAQALQMVLMLSIGLFTGWQIWPERASLLGTMVLVLFATVIFTVLLQMLDRVHSAVRQGFTIEDVRAAFLAMQEETDRAREQLLANPIDNARIRFRKRVAMFGGVIGGVSMSIAPRLVFRVENGEQVFQPFGMLYLVASTVLVGVAVAFFAARPVRVTLAQNTAQRLWFSWLGASLFARAQRKVSRELAKQRS